MTDIGKPERIPESQPDRELARLLRECDRTRAEYRDALGDEREQCWKLYQRAMANYNAALAKQNRGAGILTE